MFYITLIKLKFLSILTMVCMGLFSRLILGGPLVLFNSSATYQDIHQSHRFPDSGARTSLRFMPASRLTHKRRRYLKNGKLTEDEFTFRETLDNLPNLDFVGEVIDQNDTIQMNKLFL